MQVSIIAVSTNVKTSSRVFPKTNGIYTTAATVTATGSITATSLLNLQDLLRTTGFTSTPRIHVMTAKNLRATGCAAYTMTGDDKTRPTEIAQKYLVKTLDFNSVTVPAFFAFLYLKKYIRKTDNIITLILTLSSFKLNYIPIDIHTLSNTEDSKLVIGEAEKCLYHRLKRLQIILFHGIK